MNKRVILIVAGAAVVLLITFLFVGSSIFKKQPVKRTSTDIIELTYYKLFDNSDVIQPLIQEYQSNHSNVVIRYKQFTDTQEYYDLILNELAEGEGPDIFSVPNTWYLKNYKKVAPAPLDLMPPSIFEDTFVSVTYDDLVRTHPQLGADVVYGVPMTVDTLALFYNKEHFEDAVPETGKPADTWEGLKEDVYRLTKKDNSFERFERAGIAMGFADNISRAADILYLLIIQQKGDFYDKGLTSSVFANQQGVKSDGSPLNPGADALDLYTSFANPSNKNYSWNAYLSDANSDTKEVTGFARGKISMIIGYSYRYDEIVAEINELQSKGLKTIDPKNIKIAMIPQMFDPATSADKRDAYANYFTETVARTSQNQRVAWDFLIFLTGKEQLQHYNEKTHKPTSRRDMIEDQKLDPIYGVFADQIGFAESLPIYDEDYYEKALLKAINAVLATKAPKDAIKIAQEEINAILPSGGLLPQITVTEDETKK